MERITEKMLERKVDLINRLLDAPPSPYVKGEDGEIRACPGNFHLSHAYGGVNLCRMSNEEGGVSNVFACGHVPKRNLFDMMRAFVEGIETAKGNRR